jgi:hypothetical protein
MIELFRPGNGLLRTSRVCAEHSVDDRGGEGDDQTEAEREKHVFVG